MTKLIKKSLILKTYVFLGQFLKEMGKKSLLRLLLILLVIKLNVYYPRPTILSRFSCGAME